MFTVHLRDTRNIFEVILFGNFDLFKVFRYEKKILVRSVLPHILEILSLQDERIPETQKKPKQKV